LAKQFLQLINCLFGKLQKYCIAIVANCGWLVHGYYDRLLAFKNGMAGSAF